MLMMTAIWLLIKYLTEYLGITATDVTLKEISKRNQSKLAYGGSVTNMPTKLTAVCNSAELRL